MSSFCTCEQSTENLLFIKLPSSSHPRMPTYTYTTANGGGRGEVGLRHTCWKYGLLNSSCRDLNQLRPKPTTSPWVVLAASLHLASSCFSATRFFCSGLRCELGTVGLSGVDASPPAFSLELGEAGGCGSGPSRDPLFLLGPASGSCTGPSRDPLFLLGPASGSCTGPSRDLLFLLGPASGC